MLGCFVYFGGGLLVIGLGFRFGFEFCGGIVLLWLFWMGLDVYICVIGS